MITDFVRQVTSNEHAKSRIVAEHDHDFEIFVLTDEQLSMVGGGEAEVNQM